MTQKNQFLIAVILLSAIGAFFLFVGRSEKPPPTTSA